MIEKLNGVERDCGTYIETELTASNSELFCKINEIIDELNHIIEERESGVKVYEEIMPNMKPSDPYAEQRKWIGKLCRFWDDGEKPESYVYGVLHNVFDVYRAGCPFQCGNGERYEYCEPVSDDLIYKGE